MTLSKKLRSGQTAAITRTPRREGYLVKIDGQPFGGIGQLVKLANPSGGATYGIKCEGEDAVIGLTTLEANRLSNTPAPRRGHGGCQGCGGPLNPHGDAPGLQAVNGHCYDCR
ncbi:hypothetical protein [Streptosporangium sp. CA-115845]|uniref:hypothetical protein n=1 Tax=Streptosporangium sp. CA-115845 TaxID=3240071 RepID=UPI003D8C6E70